MSVAALLEVAKKELDPAKAKECTTDGCNCLVTRDPEQTARAWANKKFCNTCLAARITESRRRHREKNPPKVEKPKFCQNPECKNKLEQITGTTRKYCSPKCADIMKRKKTVGYTRRKRQEVKESMAQRESRSGGMVRYMVEAETPGNGKGKMPIDVFESILNRRLKLIQETLGRKAREYAHGGDRLHNFHLASKMSGKTTIECIDGMMLKHVVSVRDMVDGRLKLSRAMIDEKIGDTINYCILLEAAMLEAIGEKQDD